MKLCLSPVGKRMYVAVSFDDVSLQHNFLPGFFIFLAFVANKRTINKVRAGWMARFLPSKKADMATPQSRQTHNTKLITTAL